MKSIRLSLLLCFLVLVALTLGAVSLVVYQTSGNALQAREQRTSVLLHERYRNRCRAETSRVDWQILNKVRSLAAVAQAPWSPNRVVPPQAVGLATLGYQPQGSLVAVALLGQISDPRSHFGMHRSYTLIYEPAPAYYLGQLSAAQNPSALLLAPLWQDDRLARTASLRLYRATSFKIRFAEDLLPGQEEDQAIDYCQIDDEAAEPVQRSRSLGKHFLPLDPARAERLKVGQGEFDDVDIRPGVTLRRITYKAAMPPYLAFFMRHRPPGAARPPGNTRSQRGGRSRSSRNWVSGDNRQPVFFIQYARDNRPRDAVLAEFKKDYSHDLFDLQADTEETLGSLRQHLLWISLAAFAATVLGGFWLVRLGLSPLRRLSEAVSKISPRDFRLPVEESSLPAELKPIAERLRQTLEMLKRAFAREKQAAADISHELRTPLAALLTTIEVALRKPRSPEEYRELLADCRESGKQMTQLVERLLALARLDAGVDTLRPRETDVVSLAEQCAALVRPLAEARGVALHVHGAGPTRITADPDKLREVLTNLLHNAIQYNRPDGAIDLVVERGPASLRLEVRDTGIGIPASAREHIFERFFRGADPSRHADDLHAGLGLAIVKGYVDLMGGTIVVDSTEGQGSTFRLELPLPPSSSTGIRGDLALAGRGN